MSIYSGSTPFYTEATQKIDADTTYKIRKYYDGLGQLLQTREVGAVIGSNARTSRSISITPTASRPADRRHMMWLKQKDLGGMAAT